MPFFDLFFSSSSVGSKMPSSLALLAALPNGTGSLKHCPCEREREREGCGLSILVAGRPEVSPIMNCNTCRVRDMMPKKNSTEFVKRVSIVLLY